ncbi:tyrosine-type recombinase/integrase [Streptomyces xiamenensis]
MAKQRKRNPNGAGSITQRKDGRYMGMAYVTTPSGARKRAYVYGKTWEEADEKLTELKSLEQSGIPTPGTNSKVADFLLYWLSEEAKPNLRPKTYQGYASVVHVHLIPGLGTKKISYAPRAGSADLAQPCPPAVPVLQERMGQAAVSSSLLCRWRVLRQAAVHPHGAAHSRGAEERSSACRP